MLRGIYISVLHNKTAIKNKTIKMEYPAFFGNKTYLLEKECDRNNLNMYFNYELRIEPDNTNGKSVLLGYNTVWYSYFKGEYNKNLNEMIKKIKRSNFHKPSYRNFMFVLFIYDEKDDIFESFYIEAKNKIAKELNIDSSIIKPIGEPGSLIENISKDKIYHYYTEKTFENSEEKSNSNFLEAYFLSQLFFYFNLNYNFINRRTIYRFFYYWKKNKKNKPILSNKQPFFKIFSYIRFTYYVLYYLFHLFSNEGFIYDVLLYLFPNNYYDYYAWEFYKNNNYDTKSKLFRERLMKLWENLPVFTMAYIGAIIAIIGLFISNLR